MTTDDRRRDELAALTGAWALDALDDAERAEFERFLADADEVRSEATELADTAVYLGLAIEPEQPRPELRASILDAIADLPQQARPAETAPSVDPVAPVAVPAVGAVPVTAVETPAEPTPAELKARSRWGGLRSTLVSVAAGLVVIGGVVGGVAGLPVLQRGQEISAVTSAADVQRASADVVGGGTAELAWSPSEKRSVLTTRDLSGLSADEIYQLWYIDGSGAATSAGTFRAGQDATTTPLSGSWSKGDTIGVTVEPDGGSKQPTTTPIVAITTA
ncbi:anti-sigma factor domain-containing protein [Schumannella sp. 10F1B-5-1]|uniref:anti-sigma factor n=1 Tax=Schumannella sp. 10F1B-5-1 TaxID=2590780 RepID=UPI001131740E|nr:anti-sigma factor [Schumannella sp. 10F1B-5-1]TPW72809.1 anti-sigma factor [Schumannella sp. 10F1B-5-1]